MVFISALKIETWNVALVGDRWGIAICLALVLALFIRCYLTPLFWSALASRFLKRNENARAIDAFDRALRLSPRDARLWLGRGATFRRLGRLDDALASLKKAWELAPDQLSISQELVRIYRGLGRFDDALATLDRQVDLGCAPTAVMLTRCVLEIDARRFSDAEKSCDRLIETNAEALAAHGYALRGIARLMLGRTDDSLADFETSYLLDPRSVDTRAYFAATWYRRQMFGKAITLCDSILRDDPKNALARHIRGLSERAIGRDFQSVNDLNIADELKRGSRRVQ